MGGNVSTNYDTESQKILENQVTNHQKILNTALELCGAPASNSSTIIMDPKSSSITGFID